MGPNPDATKRGGPSRDSDTPNQEHSLSQKPVALLEAQGLARTRDGRSGKSADPPDILLLRCGPIGGPFVAVPPNDPSSRNSSRYAQKKTPTRPTYHSFAPDRSEAPLFVAVPPNDPTSRNSSRSSRKQRRPARRRAQTREALHVRPQVKMDMRGLTSATLSQ